MSAIYVVFETKPPLSSGAARGFAFFFGAGFMGSADEYLEMLSQCDFRNLKFTDLTVKVKKTWTICALRLIRRIVADPELRRRLRDPRFTNRIFAKTIFRIRFAYETGAMRYGIFSAVK